MKVDFVQISTVAGQVAGSLAAVYGAFKGYVEGSNVIKDWRDSRDDPRSGYTVKSTISKTVIRDDRTECIRLRTIRANRRVTSLKIDHQPVISPAHGPERLAVISNYYAMPGRATRSDDEMFQINLLDDEALSAHKDHSIVLGYVIEESRDELFIPPGVVLFPPAGSDYAVIEVHFPGWHLSLDVKNKPEIRFYLKDPKTMAETEIQWPSKEADVTFPDLDRSWIRAWVKKPPQGSEICLFWAWQRI